MHTRQLINVQTHGFCGATWDRLRGHVTTTPIGDNQAAELRTAKSSPGTEQLSPALHAITSTETAQTCHPAWIRQQKRYEDVDVRSASAMRILRAVLHRFKASKRELEV